MKTFKYDSILNIGADRYKVYKRLTHTHSSEVWLVYNHTGIPFVIKIACANNFSNTNSNQKAIENEIHWLQKLRVPGIVQIQNNEMFSQESVIDGLHISMSPTSYSCLPLEYLPGGTLKDLVCKSQKNNLISSLTIIRNIAETLSYMHASGCVHLDIKPQNIMFRQPPKTDGSSTDIQPILIDFGSTKSSGCIESIEQASVSTWMAPELQAAFHKKEQIVINPSMDVYSLGLLLYYLLTGKEPQFNSHKFTQELFFHSAGRKYTNSSWNNPKIRKTLIKILQGSLYTAPEKRSTADEIVCEIDHLFSRWNSLEIEKRSIPKNQKNNLAESDHITGPSSQIADHFDVQTILGLNMESATTIIQSRINECIEHEIEDEVVLLRKYESLLLDISNSLQLKHEERRTISSTQSSAEKSCIFNTPTEEEFVENKDENYDPLLQRKRIGIYTSPTRLGNGLDNFLARLNWRQKYIDAVEKLFSYRRNTQPLQRIFAATILMTAIFLSGSLLFNVRENTFIDPSIVGVESHYINGSFTTVQQVPNVVLNFSTGTPIPQLRALVTPSPMPWAYNWGKVIKINNIVRDTQISLKSPDYNDFINRRESVQAELADAKCKFYTLSLKIDGVESNSKHFSLWAGDRLPTAAEWEIAAYGNGNSVYLGNQQGLNYIYPWSISHMRGTTNVSTTHIATHYELQFNSSSSWVGDRLPTATEWEIAAHGNGSSVYLGNQQGLNYIYPWSINYVRGTTNVSTTHIATRFYPTIDMGGAIQDLTNGLLIKDQDRLDYGSNCDLQDSSEVIKSSTLNLIRLYSQNLYEGIGTIRQDASNRFYPISSSSLIR